MESKSILSNQDLAKVFALYFNSWTVIRAREFDAKGAHTRFFSVINNSVDAPHITIGEHKFSLSECRLELTPLEDISDEDAIEAAKIMGATDEDIESVRKETGGIKILFEPFYNIDYKIADNDVKPILVFFAYQYLIQQGIAVPLFFGINHWANGKTAIQLNIAINKNNTQ